MPRAGLPRPGFRRLMIEVDAHKNRINLDCTEILTDLPPQSAWGTTRWPPPRNVDPGQRFEMTLDAHPGRFARHHCVFTKY
jgi:hypothetical protein